MAARDGRETGTTARARESISNLTGSRTTTRPGGRDGKSEMYLHAKKLIHEKRIRLPEHPRLLTQLRQIVSRPAHGGGVIISSPRRKGGGGHGDLASALVCALWRAKVGSEVGWVEAMDAIAKRGGRIWDDDDPTADRPRLCPQCQLFIRAPCPTHGPIPRPPKPPPRAIEPRYRVREEDAASKIIETVDERYRQVASWDKRVGVIQYNRPPTNGFKQLADRLRAGRY